MRFFRRLFRRRRPTVHAVLRVDTSKFDADLRSARASLERLDRQIKKGRK